MKRNISIFTFLLGAFAAGLASEAGADQTVYGGYCYFGEQYRGDLYDMYMKVNDFNMPVTLKVPGDKAVCTATKPNGMRIADNGWGYVKAEEAWSATLEIMEFDNVEWDAKSSPEYTWTYDGKPPACVAIAVRFDYIKYTLKFVSSQGGTMPEEIKTTYDEANLIPAPSSAPTGYHFDKWIATSSFDKEYRWEFETGASVSGEDFGLAECHEDNSIITLMAQWAPDTYAVSSTGENCKKVTVEASAAYTDDLAISWEPDGNWVKPTVTVYAGTDDKGTAIKTYSNLGEGTTSVTFKMSDLGEYYEKIFTKVSYNVYTITYNGNGGFFSNPMETSVTRRIENNTRISEFPEVHWDGDRMSLKGWYRAAGSEIEVNIGDLYDFGMNMEFYAEWDPSSTFNISGEVLPSGVGRIEGTNSYVKGKAVTLTAFPANGYSFVEWRRGDVRITDSTNLEVTVEGDAHYTAFFTGNVYKVSFDWDDNAIDGWLPPSKMVTFGQPYGMDDAIPDDPDFVFDHWVDDEGNRITSESLVTIDKRHTLYACVIRRPSYTIAYNGNGSTSDPMPNQKMYCGVADNLTSNAYERIGYHFRGWATNMADAAALKIAYADGERVMDIASTNETATLYAVWDAITFSEAMHCNDPNLAWKSSSGNSGNTNPWFTAFGEQIGDGTDSCVRQKGGDSQQWLVAQVVTNGSLSFSWKPTGCDGPLSFWIGPMEADPYTQESLVDLIGEDGSWSTFSTNGIPAGSWIHLYLYSDAGTCDIDQMTWTPEGSEPKQGKPVRASAAGVEDGIFSLTIPTTSGVAYGVWTNADLTVPAENWGLMEIKKADGETLDFSFGNVPGIPQLFFRAYEVK